MLYSKTIFSFLYFVIQYISYTPLITLISKKSFKCNKCVLFALLNAIISTTLYQISQPLCISMVGILYVLIVYISSIVIFNVNNSIALVFSTICSIAFFFTNILYLSFNISILSNNLFMFKYFIMLCVMLIFHNFLSNHSIKNVLNFLKSSENTYEIYFLAIIIIFSFNFTYLPVKEIAYASLLIQSMLAFFIYKIIKSTYDINHIKLSIINKNYEYNKLKSIVDDIRMFKHDYNNTLCSIGGYISLNDMNGLKRFYGKLTSDITKTNNTQMITPKIINEPSIYNLLMSKYNEIVKKNLSFDFYSTIDYKKLNISPYDFSKILGILLDNAIDAANKTDEKKICLYCETNKNKDYEITIKNSYINKEVDIEKIFLKGYSSKAVKSGLRFMGSFKSFKIISKYFSAY